MRQKALLTTEEQDILKSLIGKPIKGLVAEMHGYGQFDGLYLISEGQIIVFSGLEVSTPTAAHATDEVGLILVDRSNQEKVQQLNDYRALKVGHLGVIKNIWRV